MTSVKLNAGPKEYFILLVDRTANKKSDVSFLSKTKSLAVYKGSLWLTNIKCADKELITLHSFDDAGVSLVCEPKCICLLSHTEFQLLIAIANYKERYLLYRNEYSKLHIAVNLYKSSRNGSLPNVKVKVNCENTHRYILGYLLQIGCVENRPGLWFKIKSDNNKGNNSEIFVALSQIREFISENSTTHQQLLKVGDRVVWISDRDIPEYAIVRWCGILEEYPDHHTYGVELDNKVGSGTGLYRGKQLFKARMDHASFIPAVGLMKAEDFDPHGSIKSSDVSQNNGDGWSHSCDNSHLDLTTLPITRPSSNISTKVGTNFIQSNSIQKHKDFYDFKRNIHQTNLIKPLCSCESDMRLCTAKCEPEIAIGSMVQVDIPGLTKPQFGVVRWKGVVYNEDILGIELEEPCSAATNGRFDNEQKFICGPKRGYFAKLSKIHRDNRFIESHFGHAFGNTKCLVISEHQSCLLIDDKLELMKLMKRSMDEQVLMTSAKVDVKFELGRNLGIQGHHNSCYMDVTLFAMFAFNCCFDSLLFRRRNDKDVLLYDEIQATLLNEIVNPLRCNLFVRADKMLKLRHLMNTISSISGFLTEEKDPEELLHCLFMETLKTEPFIKFSSGSTEYSFQLIVNGADEVSTSTQGLLQSTLSKLNLTFFKVPSCLILQLPRCGKEKVFHSIFPSPSLKIVVEQEAVFCFICGKGSLFKCDDCQEGPHSKGGPLDFCASCLENFHSNVQRKFHRPYLRGDYHSINQSSLQSLEVLELFAVICIKTSHYVCYTKCGLQLDSPWVFFDSMSDRVGLDGGYNVPKMTVCEYLSKYLLHQKESKSLNSTDIEKLPEELIRFVCDGYVCMYRNSNALNYR